jgi:DNA-binding MarR family transcriptional regulator
MFASMRETAPSVDAVADQLHAFACVLGRFTRGAVFDLAHELELSLSQLRALHVLANADEPMTLTELAPALHLSVAATGRLLDGLERAGLVVRREDEEDRRVKRLALTAEGEHVMERLATATREGLRGFAATLNEERRACLSRALTTVLEKETR